MKKEMDISFIHKTFFTVLFIFATLIFAKPGLNIQHPDSCTTNPVSTLQKPDYRNHLNIPEYDPSLMPLKSVRTGTGVWTELNPKVPRVDYLGIHFINKDTGWACGGNGVVIKTTDGGVNWIIANTTVTTLLLKVHSLNGQIVIATGYDGIIIRSTDGGINFSQVISGVGNGRDLWGVKMLNDSLGWVCGMNQTLLKTTDAGLSWQMLTPGLNQHYWSLDFLNEQCGMIACGSGKVLKTTDGGNTWAQIQAGDTRSLYTLDVIDSLHIAAGGGPYGKNVYSSDGGSTWIQNTNLIFENGVNCISFINADTGYAIGENWAINKTENRGVTWWASDPVYADWWLNLLPNAIGYAAGDALRLYKTRNGYDNWEKLFFTDNINDVCFINDDKGFIVVRDPAKLYKSINGGISWDSVPGAPGGVDLLFLDSANGFIASDKIFKTTDGGDNWYQTNSLGLGAGKFFFITNQIGWATSGKHILKTTDNGENWVVQFTAPGAGSFRSIYFVDSLYGWASIINLRPFKTTDGGNNWIEQTNFMYYQTYDIYFTNYEIGWIVISTWNSTLLKSSDSGINWISVPEIIGAYGFHFFPDPLHWLINGSHRYITEDGGYTFLDITNDVLTGFGSFGAVTDKLGYAVGGLGLILRYDDTSYIPVELISVKGRKENDKAVLYWITVSELNNQGFYIEKSYDKIYWETIGFINGKGTTTETNYYNFKDRNICSGENNYRLKQIDFDGTFTYSDIVTVYFDDLPLAFELFQNYPNPFNPLTKIQYDIPTDTKVQLTVYDILGCEVKTLVNEFQNAGRYTVNLSVNNLSSGVYIYQLKANNYIASKKMIVTK